MLTLCYCLSQQLSREFVPFGLLLWPNERHFLRQGGFFRCCEVDGAGEVSVVPCLGIRVRDRLGRDRAAAPEPRRQDYNALFLPVATTTTTKKQFFNDAADFSLLATAGRV